MPERPIYWEVPEDLRRYMVEIAREFRKVQTPSEGILWQALRGRKLDGLRFRRQQPIGLFVVDFLCFAYRLVVEVDGPIHERQKDADAARQEALERLGLRFVRIASGVVERDLPRALEMIRKAVAELQASGTVAGFPSPPNPLSQGGRGGEESSQRAKPGRKRNPDRERFRRGRRVRRQADASPQNLETLNTPSPSLGEGDGG